MMSLPGTLLEIAIRVTLILAAGLLVALVLKRASASTRHLVLLVTVFISVSLPLLVVMAPRVDVPLPPSQTEKIVVLQQTVGRWMDSPDETTPSAEGRSALSRVPAANSPRFSWADVIAVIVLLGMGVQGLRTLVGLWSLKVICREARRWSLDAGLMNRANTRAGLKKTPDILLSERVPVAFLMGWWRPCIVLPLAAPTWTEDKLTMVLAHEMAHIRRGDHWVQPLALLFRAFYWWHPLALVTSRWLKRERERASDDLVLQGPTRPSDYAELLLEAASLARTEKDLPTVALAMAGVSGVEERVLCVLNPHLLRNPASLILRWVVALAGLGLLVFVGSTGLRAEEEKPDPLLDPGNDSVQPFVKFEFTCVEIPEEIYQAHKDDVDRMLREPLKNLLLSSINKSDFLRDKVDIIYSPEITVKLAQSFNIQVQREFPYPVSFDSREPGLVTPSSFETKNLGVALLANATLIGDSIMLNGKLEVTDFVGFTESDVGIQTPSFETREMRFLQKLESGGMRAIMAPWVRVDKSRSSGSEISEIKKRLILVLQASLTEDPARVAKEDFALLHKAFLREVKFENAPLSEVVDSVIYVLKEANGNQLPLTFYKNYVSPMPQFSLKAKEISVFDVLAEIEKQTGYGYTFEDHRLAIHNPELIRGLKQDRSPVKNINTGLPYATPVPLKPGFVTSPYAPDSGLVDLRGFAPGTPVKCPYTEKMFLAP